MPVPLMFTIKLAIHGLEGMNGEAAGPGRIVLLGFFAFVRHSLIPSLSKVADNV